MLCMYIYVIYTYIYMTPQNDSQRKSWFKLQHSILRIHKTLMIFICGTPVRKAFCIRASKTQRKKERIMTEIQTLKGREWGCWKFWDHFIRDGERMREGRGEGGSAREQERESRRESEREREIWSRTPFFSLQALFACCSKEPCAHVPQV